MVRTQLSETHSPDTTLLAGFRVWDRVPGDINVVAWYGELILFSLGRRTQGLRRPAAPSADVRHRLTKVLTQGLH